MRVLMVQTLSVEGITQERVYPIGIVSLAGIAKAGGHDVEILDMNLEVDPYGKLKERLLSFEPQVVAFSLRNIDPLANKTSSLIPSFIATVRLVSAVLPDAWLVAGGTGFSLFPERLMAELPEIHYGIVGEAETSFPALLSSLANPPPTFKGSAGGRDRGSVVCRLPGSLIWPVTLFRTGNCCHLPCMPG